MLVVFSFDNFRSYLVGTKVVVYTDHATIKYLKCEILKHQLNISLNIIGGGNLSKRNRINNIINSGKANIFFIQESKWREVDSSIIRSLWRNHEVGWSYSSSLGQSGGIITMWNEGFVRPISSFKGEGYLKLKLAWKSDIYYAVNIYSACGISLKRKIWSELIKLKRKLSDGLWIMGGDFNVIFSFF